MPNTEPLFSEAKTVRPGAKRQGVIALVVVVALIAVVVAGFVAARPEDTATVLRGAAAAQVEKRTVRDVVSVGGTLELGTTESLVSPERATIVDVPVAEGDSVKAGQIVAVVSDADLQTLLEQKRADLSKLLREVEQASAVAGFDTRSQALDESKTRRELAQSQTDRDRVAALVERKLAAQSELDSADSRLAASKEALDSLLLQKERSDTLARIAEQNRVSDRGLLEDAIAELEKRVAACKVRAGSAGVVYTVSAKKGKTAAQYEELAVVGAPASMRVAADVPETRASSVKVGTTATIYVGESPYAGVVEYLASYATTSSSGSGATVRANLAFVERPASAVAGSSVTAELVVGEIAGSLVLPRGPWLTSGDYTTAYVVQGATARKVAVKLGTADGNSIQVLSGLAAGDLVLTGNYAEFIHLDEVRVEGVKKE
jgi:HlyD family secretion protein